MKYFGEDWTIFHEQLVEARQEALENLRLDSERAIDFYNGVQRPYMDTYFEKVFENWTDARDKIPLVTFNTTKAIINGLSKLYKEGAQREVWVGENLDEKATKLYNEITNRAKKPAWMKTVDKITRLVKTVLVHPYWDTEDGLSYRVFSPDLCDVRQAPYDPQKFTAVVFKLSSIDTSLSTESESDYYVYWDTENTYWIDEWGNAIINPNNPDAINPYKMLTFTVFRDSLLLGNQFWGDIDETIVGVNIDVNAMATDLKHLSRMQCFSQAVVIGDVEDNFKVDSLSVIQLPTGSNGSSQYVGGQPDFKFVSPDPKMTEMREIIDFWQKMAYNIEKISPQSVTSQTHLASGFAIMAANLPLIEDRQDRSELFASYERDLYQVEKAVYNYNAGNNGLPLLPENSELHIKFPDLTFPLSKDEKIKWNDYRINNNLISCAGLAREENPALRSDEEAMEFVEANKEINDSVKSTVGTGLFEEEFEKEEENDE